MIKIHTITPAYFFEDSPVAFIIALQLYLISHAAIMQLKKKAVAPLYKLRQFLSQMKGYQYF
jgi:hypothetical protein